MEAHKGEHHASCEMRIVHKTMPPTYVAYCVNADWYYQSSDLDQIMREFLIHMAP